MTGRSSSGHFVYLNLNPTHRVFLDKHSNLANLRKIDGRVIAKGLLVDFLDFIG